MSLRVVVICSFCPVEHTGQPDIGPVRNAEAEAMRSATASGWDVRPEAGLYICPACIPGVYERRRSRAVQSSAWLRERGAMMPLCPGCGERLIPGTLPMASIPDFEGQPDDLFGQTQTAVPVLGKGPFGSCPRCRIVYQVREVKP